MHELFTFFARNSKWFVFAVYVVLSIMLLVGGDPYHRHIYLTSANRVTASVYDFSNNATGYFNLRERNADLNRRNAELQSELLALRECIQLRPPPTASISVRPNPSLVEADKYNS